MARIQAQKLTDEQFREAFVRALKQRVGDVAATMTDRELIEIYENLGSNKAGFWGDIKEALKCQSNWPVKHYCNKFRAAKYTQKLQELPEAKRKIEEIALAALTANAYNQKQVKKQCYDALQKYDIFPIQIDNYLEHFKEDCEHHKEGSKREKHSKAQIEPNKNEFPQDKGRHDQKEDQEDLQPPKQEFLPLESIKFSIGISNDMGNSINPLESLEQQFQLQALSQLSSQQSPQFEPFGSLNELFSDADEGYQASLQEHGQQAIYSKRQKSNNECNIDGTLQVGNGASLAENPFQFNISEPVHQDDSKKQQTHLKILQCVQLNQEVKK